LWSKPDRIDKVLKDVEKTINHKYPLDFTCLTYGADLHNMLLNLGVDSVCICPYDRMFPETEEFAHKINAFQEAAKRSDKWISLDWDVFAMRQIPDNFDSFYKDKVFESNLRQYYNPKVKTREHKRKLPCASFLFFGDKSIPSKVYDLWKNSKESKWREERFLRYWVDSQCPNGELDLDYYKEHFESKHFCLKNSSVFRDRDKDTLFQHFSGNRRD